MSSSDNNMIIPPPPPLYIQIEIMKRLPVKPLLKFRSVSRTWKSVIHSSTFITDYNNLNSTHHDHMLLAGYFQENVCVIQADDDDDNDDDGLPKRHKSTLNFPSYRQPSATRQTIIGCSQGLLAFSAHGKDNVIVVIWNPSIRKSVTIPVPNVSHSFFNHPAFGFGVVSNNATDDDDDPVIVKIHIYKETSLVEVFKLSTGSWRTLSSDCLPCKSLDLNSDSVTKKAVAIDRFIYWHVFDKACDGRHLNLIWSFNMISEDFTEILLPDSLSHKGSRYDLNLSKLRESLAVLESNLVEEKKEYDVWIMEEHGVQKSFKKLYTIKAPNASIKNVFGFRKNGQAIVKMLNVSDKQTSLFVYEPGSQRFNDSGIPAYGSPHLASSYTRTLLLLNHLDKYKLPPYKSKKEEIQEKHKLQPYKSKKKEKVEEKEESDDDMGFSLFEEKEESDDDMGLISLFEEKEESNDDI